MISPLPGLETIPLKPGSGAFAIPGVDLAIVDESGTPLPRETKGYLIIRKPWPGMLLTLWGDDEKYKTVYWSKYKDSYYTGDYAIQDKDGYFWLLGRADDVLKVAGHRIGTAELESSMVSHASISEAAVCGIPDEIKGEAIIAFLVPKEGVTVNDLLRAQVVETIRTQIGPIATPQSIHFVSKLPKHDLGSYSLTQYSFPRNIIFVPFDALLPYNSKYEIGTSNISRDVRISFPTNPVAPTMANLMITV